MNCALVICSNPLKEGKAESPRAGFSELSEQWSIPFNAVWVCFPFPYATVMPLVLKTLQQLVKQNLYIQVNALQLVDLGVIALKHEHPLTGRPHSLEVDLILK